MDFDYSDEQKQLKQEARRFLDAECPSSVVHRSLDQAQGSFDKNLWRKLADLGWLGAVIPEQLGGSGLGYVELCGIAEEMGRAMVPLPISSTVYLFAEALMLAGSPEQQAKWLPLVAAGKVIGCLATSEGPGPLGNRLPTAAVETGKLRGVKVPVTDGAVADIAIVLAMEAGQQGLFLVDLRQDGVRRVSLSSLDDSRGLGRLSFDNARAERLGSHGAGRQLVDQLFDRTAVLIAFEQTGGADRCLEMAREYALQRHTFGRLIGSYQAIKHRLADMYVRNELARSNAYYAAWALASNSPDLAVAAAAARIAASHAYGFAAKENIQIHGGFGFTWEADPQLHFRRARHLSLVCGAPAVWSERLVASLVRKHHTVVSTNEATA